MIGPSPTGAPMTGETTGAEGLTEIRKELAKPGSKLWWLGRYVTAGDVRHPQYELSEQDRRALTDMPSGWWTERARAVLPDRNPFFEISDDERELLSPPTPSPQSPTMDKLTPERAAYYRSIDPSIFPSAAQQAIRVILASHAKLKSDAELYRHMKDVAEANGFDSLTDAITRAVKAEALLASHAALEARLREAEEVVKPFAALADCYDPPEGDDHMPLMQGDGVTIGDLRRARAFRAEG